MSHGYGGSRRGGRSHGYGGSRRRYGGYSNPSHSARFNSDMSWLFAKQLGGRRFVPGRNRTGGYYGRYSYAGSTGGKGELKFHDVDLDDALVASGGTVTPSINLIAQGTTESTRNGRKCTIKAIQWRYKLILSEFSDASNPPDPDSVRMIMFVDTQCNGATAAVTDVLESADWQSFRNLANSQRFNILYDKTHLMNYIAMSSETSGNVSVAAVIRNSTFYKSCTIPLEFDSTAGALTEIRSNNVGVLAISSNGVTAVGSKIRLRFSDASARC